MKKMTLILFISLSIAFAGCNKKAEEAESQGTEGTVQNIQDTTQLVAQYKDIIAKDPKNYDALVALGNIYFDSGQHEKAIETYQKALELNPNDSNVRTDMGTMYRKIGNTDKAIETFRKSASINPKHENSWYNLGVTLYNDKNDLKGAVAAWEELLKINPNHPSAEGIKNIINQAKNPQAAETAKSPSSGWTGK